MMPTSSHVNLSLILKCSDVWSLWKVDTWCRCFSQMTHFFLWQLKQPGVTLRGFICGTLDGIKMFCRLLALLSPMIGGSGNTSFSLSSAFIISKAVLCQVLSGGFKGLWVMIKGTRAVVFFLLYVNVSSLLKDFAFALAIKTDLMG